jgi:hypothetical protein
VVNERKKEEVNSSERIFFTEINKKLQVLVEFYTRLAIRQSSQNAKSLRGKRGLGMLKNDLKVAYRTYRHLKHFPPFKLTKST